MILNKFENIEMKQHIRRICGVEQQQQQQAQDKGVR